jgi:hypothetical protein
MAEKLTVASPSAAVEKMRPDWDLAEALLGGTRAMRDEGEEYLPKWPAETSDAYKRRLAVSVLYPAYQRTVTTLASKPFSKPVAVGEDVPDPVREVLADLDMQGRNLDRFAADVFETVAGYGLAGILVDFPDAAEVPTTEAGVRTQAAEQAAGLRPYWVHIKPEQILGWRAALSGGQWVFRMLRLMECVEEPDGDFGTREVEQVRVLEPGRWSLYREVETAQGKEWGLYREGITTLDIVPFVPCYGRREGFMMATPPLVELAHLNVAHWQSASDQQNILHVARVPILVAKNVGDPADPKTGEVTPWELKIGAGAAVRISGQDCGLEYVEHSGQAIQAGADDLKALEDRMRQAGAELLVISQGQKTRIEAAGDNEVAMCALQRMTLAFEDALDVALDYTARWIGLGRDAGGHVELFKDFGATTLAEATAQLLLDANMAGKLSDETLHHEFQRRGILAPDSDWETEQDRLQSQGPSLGSMGGGDAGGGSGSGSGGGSGGNDGGQPTVSEPHPPLDLTPVAEAIAAGMEAIRASMPQQMDLPALLAAIQPQQPAPINITAPAPDLSGIAAAIANMQPAQVTVHPPAITVEGHTTNVNVPEQPPAQVNVTAPAVNVAPPNVQVTVEKGGKVRFTDDGDGNLTGAVME